MDEQDMVSCKSSGGRPWRLPVELCPSDNLVLAGICDEHGQGVFKDTKDTGAPSDKRRTAAAGLSEQPGGVLRAEGPSALA
jgi:hypothetical protein